MVFNTTADDCKRCFLFSERVVLVPGVAAAIAIAIAIAAVDDNTVVTIASFVGVADDATTDDAAATDLNKSYCSIKNLIFVFFPDGIVVVVANINFDVVAIINDNFKTETNRYFESI